MRSTSRILATASFAAIAVAGMPGLALAQNATQPEAAQAPDPALNTSEEEADDEAIVVTGSRIRRSEFSSPDPIQVLDPALALQQGLSSSAELINQSPLASGSLQITSLVSTNFVTNGGAGAETISLRGLGAERTLVLLNGRRAGPAGVRGAVSSFDLSVLPASILQSAEILKTGASSIYGSDAIAGVINFITRRSTDGIEVNAFSSIPLESGGELYNISAVYGRDFGRGAFLIAADYRRQQNLRRNDRDFLDCNEEYLTFVNGARADLVDARTGRPSCGGTLYNAILLQQDFTGAGFSPGFDNTPLGLSAAVFQYQQDNPQVAQLCLPVNGFNPGVVAPASLFACGFNGPSNGITNRYPIEEQFSNVIDDRELYTIYAQGSYELTPSVEIYAELLYNNRRTHNDGYQQWSVIQYTGNSLLPDAFCNDTIFNCDPGDAGDPFNSDFAGNFEMLPLGVVESDSSTNVDYYRGVLGLRGDFGSMLSGWSWDVYGQYSRSDATYTSDIFFEDSFFTQEFRTRSCVGLVTPVRGVPCIDIDFSDPRVLRSEFTPAESAFLFGEETGNTLFEQTSGEIAFTGSLFELPAGSVGLAFGASIRRDEILDTPGEESRRGNRRGSSSSGITGGATTAKEVFGEIEIPLIHNTRFIENLTLTGAARYTSVNAVRQDGLSDSFNDVTWKLGANWAVTDWLRFRGSWGTSFRAPALFQLFLENQTGFPRLSDIDICINTADNLADGSINQRIFDNCAADGIPDDFQGGSGAALSRSGGGLGNLESETSTARVASVVLTPETRGILWGGMQLSLVVDYFEIDVRDEITTLGARNIVIGCYNSEFFPDEPLCDLFNRNPAGGVGQFEIDEIIATYVNVNRQENSGIDVTVRAVQDLQRWGSLTLQGQMTWQLTDTVELFEGTVVSDNGEEGDPKWTGNFSANWQNGPWSVVYGLNVIGGTSNLGDLIAAQGGPCRTSVNRPGAPAGQPRVPFCEDVRLEPTFYHSLSVTREFGNRLGVTVGVSNLFDTAPPRASSFTEVSVTGQVPTFGSQYDYLGRRVFANVRLRF